MQPGGAKEALLRALAAQIPPEPPQRPLSELDDFTLPDEEEPDGPVNAELRRLLQGLRQDPIDEWLVTTAMGRLRHLYPQGTRADDFSDALVTVLREVVAAYPALRECPRYVRPDPGRYVPVGGNDERAGRGYSPQHRSRFLDLFH
jgi:hypothetical protein